MTPAANNTVIIIAGPTAVGKTALAIQLARELNTEIISADSRQCYQELNIGVARPSAEELAAVKHHFIASHSIRQEISAAGFEKYALHKVNELFQEHSTVVMTGGTGLYIKAFCEGLDEIPAVSPAIREAIAAGYKAAGISWLQETLQQKDPAFASAGEMQNPHRMMRALEVLEGTGHSITYFQKGRKETRDFNIYKLGLDLPREQLYARINTRVHTMMEAGLLEEVKALLPYRHLNALQTVGYAELFAYLDGNTSLDRAIELIQQNSRRYAKRQLTWFKRDPDIQWMAADGHALEKIMAAIPRP